MENVGGQVVWCGSGCEEFRKNVTAMGTEAFPKVNRTVIISFHCCDNLMTPRG